MPKRRNPSNRAKENFCSFNTLFLKKKRSCLGNLISNFETKGPFSSYAFNKHIRLVQNERIDPIYF